MALLIKCCLNTHRVLNRSPCTGRQGACQPGRLKFVFKEGASSPSTSPGTPPWVPNLLLSASTSLPASLHLPESLTLYPKHPEEEGCGTPRGTEPSGQLTPSTLHAHQRQLLSPHHPLLSLHLFRAQQTWEAPAAMPGTGALGCGEGARLLDTEEARRSDATGKHPLSLLLTQTLPLNHSLGLRTGGLCKHIACFPFKAHNSFLY